jgi:hypothetical protein
VRRASRTTPIEPVQDLHGKIHVLLAVPSHPTNARDPVHLNGAISFKTITTLTETSAVTMLDGVETHIVGNALDLPQDVAVTTARPSLLSATGITVVHATKKIRRPS